MKTAPCRAAADRYLYPAHTYLWILLEFQLCFSHIQERFFLFPHNAMDGSKVSFSDLFVNSSNLILKRLESFKGFKLLEKP